MGQEVSLAANLQIYEQQALAFCQSCTIVFSPMATQINNNLLTQGIAVNQSDPTTWKYYLNLSGQYYPNVDTMMTVLSLDTQQVMDFTPANLAVSPKTAAAYTIGSSYYTTLCQVYPSQTDLIKSIIYPVDLETAINSPDFTLLGWGDGYLEANEQDAIIYELNNFLQYASSRWFLEWLSYEAYYVWTFWATLWQSLPLAIFAARLKYLHTSSANSFHIWSYLQSRGLADYSDILTNQQALFLYRNLEYLIQNKGKQSTLVILVNELLDSLNVGLVGKTIYMNTATNAAECQWTPEFVSTIIPTDNSQSLEVIAPETMTEINADLVAAGFDNNSSVSYVSRQQTQISLTPQNILPTKLVEIQQLGVDQKYGSVLNTFILDTLVWAITSGQYTPTVIVTDPTTKLNITLSGKDALALYYYCIQRSNYEQPINLPSVYSPTCAFQPHLTVNSIPTEFSLKGETFPTKAYLNAEGMVNGVGYPVGTVTSPVEFSNMVADLFVILVRYIQYTRTEGNQIALSMFLEYANTVILQTKAYDFSLDTHSTYAEWLPAVGASNIIGGIESKTTYPADYMALSTAIMTALLPENNPIYTFYGYTTTATDNLYDRLRSLFVQLCSYNICFLDTTRVNAWWILADPIVYQAQNQTNTTDLSIVVVPDIRETSAVETHYIPGVDLSRTAEMCQSDTKVVNLSEQDTIEITKSEIKTVVIPLTLREQSQQETTVIFVPFHTGLGVAVNALPSS
jgi:hypothetical protein